MSLPLGSMTKLKWVNVLSGPSGFRIIERCTPKLADWAPISDQRGTLCAFLKRGHERVLKNTFHFERPSYGCVLNQSRRKVVFPLDSMEKKNTQIRNGPRNLQKNGPWREVAVPCFGMSSCYIYMYVYIYICIACTSFYAKYKKNGYNTRNRINSFLANEHNRTKHALQCNLYKHGKRLKTGSPSQMIQPGAQK